MVDKTENSIAITAPSAVVWDMINDVPFWPTWCEGEFTVELLERRGPRSRYRLVTGGFSSEIELTADHKAQSTTVCSAAGSTDHWRCRAAGPVTHVSWRTTSHPSPGTPIVHGITPALMAAGMEAAAARVTTCNGNPVAVARALAPEISDRAAAIARARTLPADLVTRMKTGGLYSMGLPGGLGGLQSDGTTIVQTIEELCRADGSTGWNVLMGNTNAFLAWLQPDAAGQLLGKERHPIMAGSTALLGRGTPSGGGDHVISGRWPFCSGCLHADVLLAGFAVDSASAHGRQEGFLDARVAFLPTTAATVHGTWETAGLEGTGSHDIEIVELRVPAEHTTAPFREPAKHEGALYRLTPYNILMVLLAGFPLGVARRAIDELTELSRTKTRGISRTPLIEDPEVIVALCDAEASLQAARALVLDRVDDTWTTLDSGDDLSDRQRAGLAMATRHALDKCRQISTRMFQLAGAGVLYLDSPLQRCLRDAHAAGQHFGFSDDLRQHFGRTFLGVRTARAPHTV